MPRKRAKTAEIQRYVKQESAVLQRVFETVPSEEIKAALIDSGDPRAISLAERLDDDAYSRAYLARHCYELKLQPKDVWNILIDSRKLEARLKLSEALAGIVQSVADSAVPQIVGCRTCGQTGEVSTKDGGTGPCNNCGGQGHLIKEPDREAQKMALEIGELLNQKVPLIAQQFNSYKGPGGGAFDVGVPDMSDWSRGNDQVFEERGAGKQNVKPSTSVIDIDPVND